MKRFICKSIAFFLLLTCLIYVLGAAYRTTTSYQNILIEEGTSEWFSMPEEITLAVFGPSTGQHGITNPPEEQSAHFFNFCLSSQTPQYDWQIMQEYSDRIQPGATVILTLTFASPYFAESSENFQSKQSRYYHILSPEHILDVDIQKYWLQQFSPILTTDFYNILNAFLTDSSLSSTPVESAGVRQADPEAAKKQQTAIAEAQWGIIAPYFPEINPVMWNSYYTMLELCQEKGWHAVLVLPPLLKEYVEIFPEEFYPTYQQRVKELTQEYDVPFLDYSHDPFYWEHYELFRDIYHLNIDGAKFFDKQLFSDIESALSPSTLS